MDGVHPLKSHTMVLLQEFIRMEMYEALIKVKTNLSGTVTRLIKRFVWLGMTHASSTGACSILKVDL